MDASVKKALLVVLLAAAAVSLLLAGIGQSWRWLVTAGLVTAIAGFLQLEITGLFSRSSQAPSSPAQPGQESFQDMLFTCKHTGYFLITAGLVLQLASIWVW